MIEKKLIMIFFKLREEILYMLSFQKAIMEDDHE